MTTEKDYSKYTVLAVDDVPLNLILVEKILQRYNFKVKKANGGQEALDMIAAEKPSLVLLDLMMPNVDGFDVLAALSKSEETSNIPVVILSALNSESDIEKALSNGAKDFVTKPILMDKLLNCILRTLGEEELPS
ncbi:MAG: response regulator [bacterium]|nr:response regulator [Hoylesella loescheii]MCI7038067.1 response regulator [Bacteroidales bacterium]MDO4209800.1 response regulator [bacterium]MDY3354575.1 response regulator [Prevotella sp.]MCI7560292.1 response regulator [Bacteroidales bacterium]